jgi:beta-mannanase
MRAVPGAGGLRFDWNPGHGPMKVPEAAWPGDDHVDIVSMDIYDRTFSTRYADPQARWQWFLTRPYGLNWLRDFARAHGNKPIGFGEWAVTDDHAPGVKHDNPTFIRGMAEFIRNNNVEYHNYFNVNAHDGDFRIQRFPESARAYQQLF